MHRLDRPNVAVTLMVLGMHAVFLYAMVTKMQPAAIAQPPVLMTQVTWLPNKAAIEQANTPAMVKQSAKRPPKATPTARANERPLPLPRPLPRPLLNPTLPTEVAKLDAQTTPVPSTSVAPKITHISQAQAAASTNIAAVTAPNAPLPEATSPSISDSETEPPSSTADYLNNPAPLYSNLSKRLGEQGRVVLRVFIGTDGKPEEVKLQTSSGYARLDQAALDAVKRWRFVPAKRGGIAQAQWFSVPIHFVLE